MAGRGPAPKDPSKKVRRNAEPAPVRIIPAIREEQPPLPAVWFPDESGKKRRFQWPARTKHWWAMWRDSPLSVDFTSTDWSELMDTALLHARYWNGEIKLAAEIRLRVAKFGATPEDRARLKIQFAAADEAEERRAKPTGGARERRGPFRAV